MDCKGKALLAKYDSWEVKPGQPVSRLTSAGSQLSKLGVSCTRSYVGAIAERRRLKKIREDRFLALSV